MKNGLIGFVLGLLILPVTVLGYFKFGSPPVATGDASLPFEKQIVRVPMRARIAREKPTSVPIPADDAAFAAGATVYRAQCVACHGLPEHPSSFAKGMFPQAPQLFVRHGDHVGVSDDAPEETYWLVANGARLTGMPAYKQVLNETEMWQVTLLLAHADKLPPGVMAQLAPAAAK